MKIDPGFVGTQLKHYQSDITWRQTTNYTAAIQDNNPVYFDDRREYGLVAHPMFAAVVTWPVLSHLDRFIASGEFPDVFFVVRSSEKKKAIRDGYVRIQRGSSDLRDLGEVRRV